MDLIIFSVAVLLLAMRSPVKADFAHAVMEYEGEIKFVLAEEVVKDMCCVGLIADFIIVDGKIPVGIDFVGVREALVEGEA